jgi:signal transduction histidine kinase
MSVIAVAILFAVIYEFYNSRYASNETVLFLDVLVAVVIVLIIQTAISAFLAYRASKSIIKPINNLNLEDPKSTPVYHELSPLVERIEAQNNQIAKQMTDLRVEHENQDAMRRDFTANVSHELKTPLTSIRGYAELIKTGIAKDEDVKKFAGKIYDESQRLVTLVGDIIKLSQLDDKDIKVTSSEKCCKCNVCGGSYYRGVIGSELDEEYRCDICDELISEKRSYVTRIDGIVFMRHKVKNRAVISKYIVTKFGNLKQLSSASLEIKAEEVEQNADDETATAEEA